MLFLPAFYPFISANCSKGIEKSLISWYNYSVFLCSVMNVKNKRILS